MGRRGIYHLPVTLPDIIARFCKLSRAEKDRLELKGRVEFLAEFPFPFETSTFYDIRNNIFFFFFRMREQVREMIFERREELVEIANLRIWNFRIDSRGLLSLDE